MLKILKYLFFMKNTPWSHWYVESAKAEFTEAERMNGGYQGQRWENGEILAKGYKVSIT